MRVREEHCRAGTHRVRATLRTLLRKTKISLRNSSFSVYHETQVLQKNHRKEGLDIQSNRWVCSAQQCLHHFFFQMYFWALEIVCLTANAVYLLTAEYG